MQWITVQYWAINCKVMIVALKVGASKLHVKVESNFYV